eukprot:scaffold6649_cov124-Isochrysis_galbana.AAC.6
MKASGNKPAKRTARRGARLARPARHTMQLDRDEGRGLSRSRVASTGTGRGACSDECEMPPKRTSDGKALFSPALARKTHLERLELPIWGGNATAPCGLIPWRVAVAGGPS